MKTADPDKWELRGRKPSPFEIHSPGFVEAICEHGVGHHRGIHGCDGCCHSMPKEIAEQTTLEE